MIKIKNIFLKLGLTSVVATPIVTIISCSEETSSTMTDKENKTKFEKTLQQGQYALIKFEGRMGEATYEDSTAFPGGTSTTVYPLLIGSHSFISAGVDSTGKEYKGFEEQLIGMKENEERIIEVIFPKVYPNNPIFAGKSAFFWVKLITFA